MKTCPNEIVATDIIRLAEQGLKLSDRIGGKLYCCVPGCPGHSISYELGEDILISWFAE